MDSITITNVKIFTVDKKNSVISNGTVVINNGLIGYVGPSLADESDLSGYVIDGKGQLALLPGLIDSHRHSALPKGHAEDLKNPLLTADDAYAAALFSYLKAVKEGTTCVVDMFRYMYRCGDAAEKIGLRLNMAPYIVNALNKKRCETIEFNISLVEMQHLSQNGKIRVSVGLGNLLECTPDTYEWAVKFSAENQIGIHLVNSGGEEEVNAVVSQFGKRPIHVLHDRGVLGPKTVIAGCGYFDDGEIDLIANTDTGVVCNSQLMTKMLEKGIKIGLGSYSTGHSLFEIMKGISFLPPEKLLRMATIDGARLLGLEHEIGSIEMGKKADLVLVKQEEKKTLGELIFKPAIHTVLIDGKVILDDGRVTGVNEPSTLEMIALQEQDFLARKGRNTYENHR